MKIYIVVQIKNTTRECKIVNVLTSKEQCDSYDDIHYSHDPDHTYLIIVRDIEFN